jgi:hypothetical protein
MYSLEERWSALWAPGSCKEKEMSAGHTINKTSMFFCVINDSTLCSVVATLGLYNYLKLILKTWNNPTQFETDITH